MTPEAFEAKWGEALRAAGYTVNNLPSGNGLYINGKWFDGRCLVQEDSRAYARGLLVAWSSDRGVSPLYVGKTIHGDGAMTNDWFIPGHTSPFGSYDAALIAGCIALAKQGT